MVDVGGLHGKVAGRVEGIALILRGFIGCFTHSQEVCKIPSMDGNLFTQLRITGSVQNSMGRGRDLDHWSPSPKN